MKNDWILDVLADLRAFARKNDLPRLTAELEQLELVAAKELASADTGVVCSPRGNVGHARRLLRAHGERRGAG